ncbi:MAG: flagellar assembly protein A, partial [Candidatus Thermochlorobacter sp.]
MRIFFVSCFERKESFVVKISDDELQAYLTIYSGAQRNPEMTLEKLKFILRNEGVVAGIKD